MYGVGLNPAYIERLEARKAKKEASGQAARSASTTTPPARLASIRPECGAG